MGRVWAEIDCQKWAANFKLFAAAVAPAVVVPVIKSDAYGLGAVAAAETFSKAGAGRVAVATLAEADALRSLGLEIQFLGAPVPEEITAIVEMDAIGSVADCETARLFSQAAVAQGRDARVHVLVDTGMGRLGLLASDALWQISEIAALPRLQVEGIYSHFPLAERVDEKTLEQVRFMGGLDGALRAEGVAARYVHMANSYAIISMNGQLGSTFNMVRPGIELHGAGDTVFGKNRLNVEQVFTLKAKLLAARSLPAGASVGYGRTYHLTSPERIGTVAIGYADGYPRSLSNRGRVLVRGRECRVAGSVCMDYIQISLANAPDAQVGDDVVLIGRQGDAEITIQSVAKAAGTISYEILTRLGSRVERRYLNRE